MSVLGNFTNADLVWELLQRNKVMQAPKRIEYYGEGYMISGISLGKDCSADILLHEDDLGYIARSVLTPSP